MIMVQEVVQEDVSLPGYVTYRSSGGPAGRRRGVCTFVRRSLPVLVHELKGDENVERVLTEVLVGRLGVCLCNVYSNPRFGRQRFRNLLHGCARWADGRGLVVSGDFNARHEFLGHAATTVKGRNLFQDAEEVGLILVTDPGVPTRPARNAIERDTTPDLAFVDAPGAEWRNALEDLGSDHRLVELSVPLAVRRKEFRPQGLVNWDAFRRLGPEGEISDLGEWSASLVDAARSAERPVVVESEDVGLVDSRLGALVEARDSLRSRWRERKNNRALRKRVAQLNEDIRRHCEALSRQQWDDVCNRAEGKMHSGDTWKLLRHLLDESRTRSFQCRRMGEVVGRAVRELGEEGVRRQLLDTFLPSCGREVHPEYTGVDNAELDKDFELWEVRAALLRINRRSAPGLDRVDNKMLGNLSEECLEALLDFFNRCWREGKLPAEWKKAKMVLIPKRGKPPGLQNLRPISLTSCVGKVLEHMLLRRWQSFLEDKGVFPSSMFRFREGLGAQDAMLVLYHEVIEPRRPGAVLGLDLRSAFDRVRHSAILRGVADAGLGRQSYNYVKDFLSGRTARLLAGDLDVGEGELGSVGTPQGSVISPVLFNLVMVGAARGLCEEGIPHSIYADDLTLWCTNRRKEVVQGTLQRGIEIIEEALMGSGLECAPEKSELLVCYAGRCRWDEMRLIAGGGPVPRVDALRVLGLFVQEKAGNSVMLGKIQGKVASALRMIQRVTSRRKGIREAGVMRMVQAFVLSHIMYVAPYLRWRAGEKNKLDAMVRRAYKSALGLYAFTSTKKLEMLGVHNTIGEIVEAHRASQIQRLERTAAGRGVLRRVGLLAEDASDGGGLTGEVMKNVRVRPVPRHMHPVRDKGRREARAQALFRLYGRQDSTVYVDAALRGVVGVAVAVKAGSGEVLSAVSVRTSNICEVEETAISLAASLPGTKVVMSDSMSAIRNFARGRVGVVAKRLLRPTGAVDIVWCPAHEAGNVDADRRARELLGRAFGGAAEYSPSGFGEVLRTRREERRVFPLPHGDLVREDAVLLRQLQVECVFTPVVGRYVAPEVYSSDKCVLCGARATAEHVLWDCETRPAEAATSSGLPPDIKAGVMASSLDLQVAVVQQARRLLRRQVRPRAPCAGASDGVGRTG